MAEAAKEKVVIEEGEAPAAAKGGKGSKKKLVIIIAAAVVLLGAGGAAAYVFVVKPKLAAKTADASAEAGSDSEGADTEEAPAAEHGGDKGEKSAKGEKTAKSGHAAKGAKGEKGTAESNNVPLEPFIVNLNDPTGTRYLKVDMVLEMRGEGCAEAIAGKRERLRDSIILLLRSKTMADLQDVDGVLNLKKEVITRANYEQDRCKALDLLFTDLVIQ